MDANTKNIQTLMVQVTDQEAKIFSLEKRLSVASNAVATVNNRVDALNALIHAALVRTKGAGSTEPE